MDEDQFAYRFEQMGRFFMGTSDVHIALDRVTRKLAELGISYAICGGMAVLSHGHEQTTADVDILLTPDGLAKFKAVALGHGWREKFPGSRGVRDADNSVRIDVLLTGGIPGDGIARGIVFPDPAEVAVERDGKMYLPLAKLIELKLASGATMANRLGDLADVIALIKVNGLDQAFGQQLHPFVQAKYQEMWVSAQWRDPQQE